MKALFQRTLASHRTTGRWRLLVLLLLLILLVSGSLFLWLARPARHVTMCRTQVIAAQQVTLAGYHLEVRLDGTYDQEKHFCGHLSAEARLSTPAHGSAGTLFVFLTNCRDNDLATKSISVPAAEARQKQQYTVSTALLPIGCGYASAQFLDAHQTRINIVVHTTPINASGDPIWEQWRP